jgi:hypothetical protein
MLPPPLEVIQFAGPDGVTDDMMYIKFTTIWCGPMGRVSKESVTKKNIRAKRFRNLLTALSSCHEKFNAVSERRKASLMIQEILPRYISALDIALMDGN